MKLHARHGLGMTPQTLFLKFLEMITVTKVYGIGLFMCKPGPTQPQPLRSTPSPNMDYNVLPLEKNV